MSEKRSKSRASLSAHYAALLAEQAQSGQTMRAFARAQGVSEWTLYEWRRRLAPGVGPRARGAMRKSPPRGRLLEVAVRPRSRATPRESREDVLVLHLFGTHRVELPRDFREDDVRTLVRALTPKASAC